MYCDIYNVLLTETVVKWIYQNKEMLFVTEQKQIAIQFAQKRGIFMEYVTLNNGIKMPKLGYGVYQTPPDDTKKCVLDAIEVGYRSIDTAQAYGNEVICCEL